MARALKLSDPLATVANANTTVPPFQIAFSYSVVRPGTLKLKEILMKPVAGDAFVKGGCSHCTGNGRFLPYTIHGGLFRERVRGTRLMTTHTRIVQAVLRRGNVGRFKLYGVKVGPSTSPFLIEQGCLAADAIPPEGATSTIVLQALLHPSVLPRVPCSGTPRGDNVTFFRPADELSTTPLPGGFSGNAGGPRWLSVFQGTRKCGPDPLAESRLTPNHVFWHVNGKFSKGFTTAPASKPGFFCAYLQSGGTFAGIPDGRIGLTWSVPYYAGDSVTIAGPTTVASGQEVTNAFEGTASVVEQLWSFESFTPCAATAQGEYGPSVGVSNRAVHGGFSLNVASLQLHQSFYRCAYLNVGDPKNKKPTGPTVARASLFITVQ